MTKIYEATRAHHFIQKLKFMLSSGSFAYQKHEVTEAIEELEKSVNIILKKLATQEQQDE